MTAVVTYLPETIQHIRVDLVRPGDNHRTVFDQDALDQLAESIRLTGQIEPIVVKPMPDGMFEIVAGERRWRAISQLGDRPVKAIVRHDMTVAEVENTMLAENTGRVDLTLMNEARAYARQRDLGRSIDEIAAVAGVARFRVEWRLSLLELSEETQAAIEAGAIPPQAALEIRPLTAQNQLAAIKAWRANPLMGATAFKKRIVARLLEAQRENDVFSLTLDWADEGAQVKAIKHTVPGLRKLALQMADELVRLGYPDDGPLVAEARNM